MLHRTENYGIQLLIQDLLSSEMKIFIKQSQLELVGQSLNYGLNAASHWKLWDSINYPCLAFQLNRNIHKADPT